jgi:hypothetical protein
MGSSCRSTSKPCMPLAVNAVGTGGVKTASGPATGCLERSTSAKATVEMSSAQASMKRFIWHLPPAALQAR